MTMVSVAKEQTAGNGEKVSADLDFIEDISSFILTNLRLDVSPPGWFLAANTPIF